MRHTFRSIFVAGVFIVGVVLPASAQQFDRAALEATISGLGLTEAQRVAARPVIEAGIRERLQILQDAGFEPGKKPGLQLLLKVRGPLNASRARTEARLDDILTPAQMIGYREIVEEQRRKLRAGLQ